MTSNGLQGAVYAVTNAEVEDAEVEFLIKGINYGALIHRRQGQIPIKDAMEIYLFALQLSAIISRWTCVIEGKHFVFSPSSPLLFLSLPLSCCPPSLHTLSFVLSLLFLSFPLSYYPNPLHTLLRFPSPISLPSIVLLSPFPFTLSFVPFSC